ncbi:MAG: hypothetical protein QMD50_03700 [Patescibacteria group bacterium]|nr:hypothetical protein [Patescibacteria group bacterium]
MINEILDLLKFYGGLERPLTLLEIFRLLSNSPPLAEKNNLLEIEKNLDIFIQKGLVKSEDGFYFLPQTATSSLKRRRQDLLLDEKWRRFLKSRFLFSCVPFLNFILAAGSLALGNVNQDSDFDVIIGCKKGRIFTVRFFNILIFGLFGIRRKRIDHKENARNKICLNHFVTSESYKLSPPYHKQWQELYKNIVPIYGNKYEIESFFKSNDWVGRTVDLENKYFRTKTFNKISRFIEFLLGSFLGDVFELLVKKIQIARIKKSLAKEKINLTARIKFNDEELEFHPDNTKIKELLEKTGLRY